MITAAVGDTSYDIVLFLHILFVFVAFAPAFVHPFVDLQTQDKPYRAEFWARVAPRSQRIYGGSLIVAGLLGFALQGMSDDAIEFGQTWFWGAIVLWVAMNGILHAVIIPGERLIGEGDESKAKQVVQGGQVITLLFLVTLYLMVFQPGR